MDRGAGQAAVFFFVTLKKDFDVLGPPVVVSLARSQAFDFVGAAQEDNSALLTPAQDSLNRCGQWYLSLSWLSLAALQSYLY